MKDLNQNKVELKLDWCSFEAAKYACQNWHYSECTPAGKLIKIGIWEDSKFIGVVIYSLGANSHIGSPYNLTNVQACELTRVALKNIHITPVSKILSISIKMLKKHCPGLKLIVSYADATQNHHGGIYQATNWIYEGEFAKEQGIRIKNKIIHRRSLNAKYGTSALDWLRKNVDSKAEVIVGLPKHKYLYPLDSEVKKEVQKLAKVYPKRT